MPNESPFPPFWLGRRIPGTLEGDERHQRPIPMFQPVTPMGAAVERADAGQRNYLPVECSAALLVGTCLPAAKAHTAPCLTRCCATRPHIVAYHVHGCRMADHGPAWQQLVRVAGYEPRRCLQAESLPTQRQPESVRCVHLCPVCQATRTAKRPQVQKRCVARFRRQLR